MNIDWEKLGFKYFETNGYVKCVYRNGKWTKLEFIKSNYIPIHIASTSLNYAQTCFEGLKAFKGKDEKIRVFRPQENYKRMERSAEQILLQCPSESLFLDALHLLIDNNREFVPPCKRGSLYLRPLLYGSGEGLGISVPDEFTFIIYASPVGPYYKTDGLQSVEAVVLDSYDRSAPNGLGSYKVAGNYSHNMLPLKKAKSMGYPINLFLDPKDNRYIDEFGTSNFFALKEDEFITPKSKTILPSITNDSLQVLAQNLLGLKLKKRRIDYQEIKSFEQIAACGTAVVLTPISKIVYNEETLFSSNFIDNRLILLFESIKKIQYGDINDKFNWNIII